MKRMLFNATQAEELRVSIAGFRIGDQQDAAPGTGASRAPGASHGHTYQAPPSVAAGRRRSRATSAV